MYEKYTWKHVEFAGAVVPWSWEIAAWNETESIVRVREFRRSSPEGEKKKERETVLSRNNIVLNTRAFDQIEIKMCIALKLKKKKEKKNTGEKSQAYSRSPDASGFNFYRREK